MTSVLVIGGTGAMGGRVAARLRDTTAGEIAVLTRSPDSPRARALARRGITVRRGDLDDADSVRAAMDGVAWVFANTDFFATGRVLGEIEQGMTALRAAREAGVDRFVWSSLDSADALTGGAVAVPHYEAKAAVAAWIAAQRAEEAMRQDTDPWFTDHVSVLTTAPYFENLVDRMPPSRTTLPDGRSGLLFRLPLAEGRYPLIALDDIAWFADHLLHQWQRFGARDLAVVGDSPTGAEIARTVEDVTGVPAAYADLPLAEVRDSIPDVGHDYAAMAAFIQRRDIAALDRDLEVLRRIHPGLQTFADWLRETAPFG